jgi:hypothetical protein
MIRRTVLLVVLVAGTLACGHKTRPLAPELVRPEAPSDIVAASIPEGIRLTWKRPEHYTGGKRMNDLAGFVVERAPGEGAAPAFARVGDIQLDDRGRFRQERRITWTDTGVTPGQLYVYRITSVTLDRDSSDPGGPVTIRYERKAAR